jgi:hypothetical protein
MCFLIPTRLQSSNQALLILLFYYKKELEGGAS